MSGCWQNTHVRDKSEVKRKDSKDTETKSWRQNKRGRGHKINGLIILFKTAPFISCKKRGVKKCSHPSGPDVYLAINISCLVSKICIFTLATLSTLLLTWNHNSHDSSTQESKMYPPQPVAVFLLKLSLLLFQKVFFSGFCCFFPPIFRSVLGSLS